MKEDVEMLCSYANLWHRQITNDSVPEVVLTRVFGISVSPEPAAYWHDTLKKLHERRNLQWNKGHVASMHPLLMALIGSGLTTCVLKESTSIALLLLTNFWQTKSSVDRAMTLYVSYK
jgi:hypothetical protein